MMILTSDSEYVIRLGGIADCVSVEVSWRNVNAELNASTNACVSPASTDLTTLFHLYLLKWSQLTR